MRLGVIKDLSSLNGGGGGGGGGRIDPGCLLMLKSSLLNRLTLLRI